MAATAIKPSMDAHAHSFSFKFSAALTQLHTTKETAAITEMKQERPTENENLIDDEESDIVLVEKAYWLPKEHTSPENATKNEKRSIRRKAERLTEKNGEL